MTPTDPSTAERPAPVAPRYWVMSLGPKAEKWDECYDEGIACIGWDHLGNLEEVRRPQADAAWKERLTGVLAVLARDEAR